ncbi:MAG: PadR family transcriptional regulator [Candidatus Hodarchaeota archaeon]
MFWHGRGLGRGIWDKQRISPVEFLMLIMLKEKPRYGYEIIQELGDRFGEQWTPKTGTVYPALQRLEKRDLIAGKLEESEAGPSRKIYSLTSKGEEILSTITDNFDREIKFLNTYVGIVDPFLSSRSAGYAVRRLKEAIRTNIKKVAKLSKVFLRIPFEDLEKHLVEYRDFLQSQIENIESELEKIKKKRQKYVKIDVE